MGSSFVASLSARFCIFCTIRFPRESGDNIAVVESNIVIQGAAQMKSNNDLILAILFIGFAQHLKFGKDDAAGDYAVKFLDFKKTFAQKVKERGTA